MGLSNYKHYSEPKQDEIDLVTQLILFSSKLRAVFDLYLRPMFEDFYSKIKDILLNLSLTLTTGFHDQLNLEKFSLLQFFFSFFFILLNCIDEINKQASIADK